MMYFIPGAAEKMKFPSNFGAIVSPSAHDSGSARKRIKAGWKWICDNGAFTGKFDESRFFAFLERFSEYKSQCVCAVAPDVVGDAQKTLALFPRYASRIHALGYRVGFVAQDGQEEFPFPLNFDVLFVGGTSRWKLGDAATSCIKRAQALGKWVHVGRVNTRKRIQHFALLKVNSVDGTHIIFKPTERSGQLIRWMHETKQPLFYM